MHVTERKPGDLARLRSKARGEPKAEQRDRLLAVVKALEGRETLAIVEAISRSRGFVQRWVYAYRDGGIEAVVARKRGGDRSRLKAPQLERLRARLDAGALPSDRVCTLRGKDVLRIVKAELGADVSLTTVYRTLHRLGYECLVPRPRHERQDLEAQRTFREEDAPLLSGPSARRSRRVEARSASSSWTRRGSASRER